MILWILVGIVLTTVGAFPIIRAVKRSIEKTKYEDWQREAVIADARRYCEQVRQERLQQEGENARLREEIRQNTLRRLGI